MENSNNKFLTIGAIIFAGLLIAGAIIYVKKPPTKPVELAETQTAELPTPPKQTTMVRQNDHVLGNPNAELSLILYFDINCFHCRNFHQTMHQLMEEYGKDGKLKWVSRHFPLNPVSQKQAEATECAAELGGNEKFWEYLDKLMTLPAPSQENLINELTNLAGNMEINKKAFKQCMENEKYAEKIAQSQQEAVELGARGTPFSIVIDAHGKISQIPGALPYEQLKQIIDSNL
jgi:protein-disulfide isomerase